MAPEIPFFALHALRGGGFLPVLSGQAKRHKDYVFGIMTTRGINNGTEAFAIRSVRDKRYKLILNLNHESKFTNACTKMPLFRWNRRISLPPPHTRPYVARGEGSSSPRSALPN
jgi:hypothetical protein